MRIILHNLLKKAILHITKKGNISYIGDKHAEGAYCDEVHNTIE
jgi:hypothetical protein